MLAQNFKTAAELSITEDQSLSLRSLLGRMERGEIPSNRFDMKNVGDPECGTAGCLLGWARGKHGKYPWEDGLDTAVANDGLWELFMPTQYGGAFDASVTQAAAALRSYLTTGEPNWAEALA